MSRNVKTLLALSIVLVVAAPLAATPAAADSPGGWSAPQDLGGEASYANGSPAPAQVAVAPDGTVMSVWSQYIDSTSNYVVQYAVFRPGSGWGPVRLIDSAYGDVYGPAVTALPNGSFYMAFKFEGFAIAVMGGMWGPEKGWTYLEQISGTGAPVDVTDIHLGSDGSGNVFALWNSNDGTESNLTANRYTPSAGWGTAQVIESYANSPFSSALAVDASGSATAVWVQNDGTMQRAFANRYTVGSGWGGTGVTIDRNSGLVNQVDAAAADDGEVVAVFSEVEGAVYRVSSTVFTPGSGWDSPEFISVDPGTTTYQATRAAIAASPGGVFAAVWHMGAPSFEDLHAATYTSSGGWSDVHNITADEDYATGELVTVTAAGQAVVTYRANPQGTHSDMFARSTTWDAATGWSPSATLDPFGSWWAALDCPSSAAPCAGQVYVTHGSYSSIGSSFYTAPDTTAPSLTLSSPADDATTDQPTVTVSGTTEPGATVTVAGQVAQVSPSGAFSVRVALATGENEIAVSATDAAGNTATAARTVTYNDPVPALQAELSAANGTIEQMKGDFSRLTSNVTQTQAQLDAVQASQTTTTTDVQSASGSAGTATMMGILGIVVGLAAIGVAFMMGRKGGGSAALAPSSTAPSPQPPAEEKK